MTVSNEQHEKLDLLFVVGFDAENEAVFETYIDEKVPLIASSFCWGDKAYVFVGALDNSLIQIFLQFDRDTQPFRTLRFTEEGRFKTDDPVAMFQKITLHKLGLFCAGSDDIVRLITFDNQEGTSSEASNITDLLDVNSILSTILFNVNYNQLLVCSMRGIDVFDVTNMEQKQSTLAPNATGKIIDLCILSPANQLIVSARDSGALEAWSIADGSRKFITHINDQVINHLICSPVLPIVIVTSSTGYFYFFQVNSDNFRLIQRIRIHSDDIRCIKFNPNGKILVSVGADNSLFIMEIRANQTSLENIFQIIYRTDIDGDPFALDLEDFDRHRVNRDVDDQQSPGESSDDLLPTNKEKCSDTRIIIALNSKTEKFGRFLIVDFDWQQYQGEKETFHSFRISSLYLF